MFDDLGTLFLSQHARLLDITTPLPKDTLLVERFQGHEALSESFHFTVDCIASDAGLDMESLLGEEATLRLLQADGGHRPWHGFITQAHHLGSDGGHARYRLVIESWLHLLARPSDCYLFQDVDVLEALTQMFADHLADHPQARWRHEVSQPLRKHSRLTQYRETDLAFVLRLLAEEGLSFRFEHTDAQDDAPAFHTLVIFDDQSEAPLCPQPQIRFHRAHATEADDAFQRWHEHRRTAANRVSLSGWDYKRLLASGALAESADPVVARGDLPPLEIYDGSRAYRFESDEAAGQRTDRLLARQENVYRRFQAEGSVRQLAPGQVFTLTQHEDQVGDEARFLTLAVDHRGANNLAAHATGLLGQTRQEAGTYRHTALVQPAWRPALPDLRRRPRVTPQGALVVGRPGEPLSTERDHRVKLQFHWQRGEAPNAGGLAGDAALPGKGGNAPGDDRSGTWVRAAEWLAGPGWGSQFLPRVGVEAWVDFLGGDGDRPVLVGQVHNGEDAPPFAAGVDGPANHPGVIAGWMSHNQGAGFNQWLVDDAPGQLRTRLACSTAVSQLTLGHLIHQAPATSWRGAWRGSGFELRSDAWAVVRAGEGLLLSATARPEGMSTQLDGQEAVGQLRGAGETARALSDAALAQTARPLAGNEAVTAFVDGLDVEQQGRFEGEVGGQAALMAVPGSRDLEGPVARFARPVILSETPADLGLSTPAGALLYAGGLLHATSQADWHLAAGQTLAAAVGEGVSWFSHAGGMKAVAAAGPVSVQAHADTLAIHADQAVTVTSAQAEVRILADAKVVLQAGEAAVTLEGGDVSFVCPGTFSVKGSGNAFVGPGNGGVELVALPSTLIASAIDLSIADEYEYCFLALHDDNSPAELIYRLDTNDQRLHEASIGTSGQTISLPISQTSTATFWIPQQ